jgi:hypothetical protein
MLAVLIAAGGCTRHGPGAGGGGGTGGYPASLKSYCEDLQNAIQSKDVNRAASMTRSLVPDEARLRKAFKDNPPSNAMPRTLAFYRQKLPPTDQGLAQILAARPNQTEVQVHGATTEELIQYAPDSVAYKEFPGGARTVAQQMLRPGMTFYEVEFLEPGKDAGMKFHLFYWDGQQWAMLGPLWQMK